jgi:hypothetical protein
LKSEKQCKISVVNASSGSLYYGCTQFIEFTYYNDRYSRDKIQEKLEKYLGLINDIKARGWNVDH